MAVTIACRVWKCVWESNCVSIWQLQHNTPSHDSLSHSLIINCSWWAHGQLPQEIIAEMQCFKKRLIRTTWWQLKAFMTEASLRNSILSRRLADSLTVLTATRVSGSPLTMSWAMPSYTMPNEPWPSSLSSAIFSRGTSHSSGTYTTQKQTREPKICYLQIIWHLLF